MADQNTAANQTNSQTTLTLRSSDGKKFTISESAAVKSETLKNMMESGCGGGEIPLETIKSGILEKVIAYLNKQAEEGLSDEDNDKFKKELFEGVHFWFLGDLVFAANFLEIQDLFDLTCATMANIIQNKNVAWVRKAFCIDNDFTPEEEAALIKENAWAYEGTDADDGDNDFCASKHLKFA